MILRIIDLGVNKGVQLIFICEGKEISCQMDASETPFNSNFRILLAAFYGKHINKKAKENKHQFLEKIPKYGLQLGENLLGEDHVLFKILKEIERIGIENLDVRIESDRKEFMNDYWEAMILPGSPYFLSAACRRFSRRPISSGNDTFSELKYELRANKEGSAELGSLLGTDTSGCDSELEQKPLRVLWLISRKREDEASVSIHYANKAFSEGGNIIYEVAKNWNLSELLKRFADKERPVHILHFDGTLEYIDNTLCFSNAIVRCPFESLIKELAIAEVPCLSLDVRGDGEGMNERIDHLSTIASASKIALDNGIGNVLSLAEAILPQVSATCFHEIYAQTVRGTELGQAVVAARKLFQKNVELDMFEPGGEIYPLWPLINHWSRQNLRFFEESVSQESGLFLGAQSPHSKKMYGFPGKIVSARKVCTGDADLSLLVSDWGRHEPRSKMYVLTGAPGIGKSYSSYRICAYAIGCGVVDYAFYFSFLNYNYTRTEIIDMISDALSFKIESESEKIENIKRNRCCIVLDDFTDAKKCQEIFELLKELESFVIICAPESNNLNDAGCELRLDGLRHVDQEILIAFLVREVLSNKSYRIEQKREIMDACGGNPWLIEKITPLLMANNNSELLKQVATFDPYQYKARFFEMQWNSLSVSSRKFLKCCSDSPNMLVEILSVVSGAPEHDEYFDLFCNCDLGVPFKFVQMIDQYELNGWFNRISIGRLFDPDGVKFVGSLSDCTTQDEKLIFSRWVSSALAMLAKQVSAHQNPEVYNHLLMSRQQWVIHIERLWFNGLYKEFFQIKAAFESLMQQVGLVSELTSWCMTLIRRTDVVNLSKYSQARFAWLILASEMKKLPDAENIEWIRASVNYWQSEYNVMNEMSDIDDLPLFHHLGEFLISYYEKEGKWQECVEIADKAMKIYRQNKAWGKLLKIYRSLAIYSRNIGAIDQAIQYENRWIDEFPYDEAPAGTRLQQMIELVIIRISNADYSNAQSMLNTLKAQDESSRYGELIDRLQCDLDFQAKNYESAFPALYRIWKQLGGVGNSENVKVVRDKLETIKTEIGEERFNDLIAEAEDAELGLNKQRAYTVH